MSTLSVSNLAKLGAGETWGPGELMFEEEEYRIDEDGGTGIFELRRKNGRRGFASAYVHTENLRPGAGAASGDDIAGITNPDYQFMREQVIYEHYSKQVTGASAVWWWFWTYSDDFVDAEYYSFDPQGLVQPPSYSELGDYYRALLPHQFEPYAGANVLAKLPPVTYVDENGDPVVVVSEEDRIRPGLGFEGLGWQLQDGEDGLKGL